MIKFLGKHSFTDYDLILPSVSVGNVGQLAVDLLLSSVPVIKIGYVWHRNITPIVAYDQDSGSLITACEIFACHELKVAVLQIRSTFGQFSSIAHIFTELCEHFKRIIILTGSYAHERKDIHLVLEPIQYLSNKIDSKFPSNWKLLNSDWKSGENLKIPGSGIADSVFSLCVSLGRPALLLVEFTSEGDNRPDAVRLCDHLDSWLSLRSHLGKKEDKWTTPAAWDTLFGKTFPKELF